MDENALRELAEERLRALAGPEAALREDQWSAIRALVLQRRRALVVQRTGWGKSAVYFVATALLRELGEGPTVIVSPLLALMRNQVEAAAAAGVNAVTINSANPEEWAAIEEQVVVGDVDVLLVSPERLNNPDFRDNVLPELTQNAGLLVVDEAHCISDWGHDFRPDYRRLRTLLTELPEGVPVLATTATANDRVVTDVSEQLGVGGEFSDPQETLVLRGTLDRESLRLGVVRLPTAQARLGWLASRLGDLPGSGIIYTLTVAATEEVAGYLRDQGYEVASYSGRTDPAERQRAEEDLLANRVKALVATSALGMGFDKPDLGFVVHLGAPSSPIAYYQQIGRAGRGVRRADALLLPGPEDQDIWSYFASLAFPPETTVRAILDALAEAGGTLSTAALEPRVELGRTRLEMVLKVLDVDGAVRRVKGGWEATGQPWSYDAERYERINAERRAEQQAMLDYLSTSGCRMEFLRRQLDDPDAQPCGRCDNCTGSGYSADVDEQAVEQAGERLRRPGVELSPRKMWPTGMGALGVPVSGKLRADELSGQGRAVGRLTDIGWGNRLRELLSTSAPDQELPEDLFNACVQVLAAWDWAQRPVGVVALGSRSRPKLVRSLASRIAEIGRLSLLGEVATNPATRPQRATNSAQRVAALWQQFRVPEELAARLSALDGPVLLMDDYADTGWTATIAGRLLREAGAPAVLPFALATTG
ncbi:RecQ-like ATP-dependent DNA helicase [Saccharopolyspora erythraea NRRL 2338]|uniref:ATP-dependent DNA helicase RecQ n=2 Tax=Saccharopolyspora erythraea TaxID=1836 RepID=A4F9M0_SACEN|nr:RecQ family ATP-dependent DNA helicase [Saccharopolyspora erythraea]EQD87324.1 ATP-dependent DNA helicase RecQ [Saccharopolyspora erythraea D]PFG94532.1 RecQ-like ATP-dependent DNA helicase [Saccharopolyspora erythraea NRRL 2338]QRK91280.1 RecQ family ATP-dependent DNA helicase [Saccharopolyspora erythraea]CAM00745.1 ATP-dependent DNA helicase, RecQ family [Saccharopolyspora erythraea NRRL 2338]